MGRVRYSPEVFEQIQRELPVAWAGRQCVWEYSALRIDRRWTWEPLDDDGGYDDFVALGDALVAAGQMIYAGDPRTDKVRGTFARPGEDFEHLKERHLSTIRAIERREVTEQRLRPHRQGLDSAVVRDGKVVAAQTHLGMLLGGADQALVDVAATSLAVEGRLVDQVRSIAGVLATELFEVTLAEDRALQLHALEAGAQAILDSSRLVAGEHRPTKDEITRHEVSQAVADSWPTQLPLFHAVWKGWSDAQTGKRARLQRAEEMTSDVERARLHDLAAGCARQAGRRPGPPRTRPLPPSSRRPTRCGEFEAGPGAGSPPP